MKNNLEKHFENDSFYESELILFYLDETRSELTVIIEYMAETLERILSPGPDPVSLEEKFTDYRKFVFKNVNNFKREGVLDIIKEKQNAFKTGIVGRIEIEDLYFRKEEVGYKSEMFFFNPFGSVTFDCSDLTCFIKRKNTDRYLFLNSMMYAPTLEDALMEEEYLQGWTLTYPLS